MNNMHTPVCKTHNLLKLHAPRMHVSSWETWPKVVYLLFMLTVKCIRWDDRVRITAALHT